MTRTFHSAAALAVVSLTVSPGVWAHHSQVLFDMNKCLTLSGTVRDWQFMSPHSWLWVVVAKDKGAAETWAFESASPPQMTEVERRWSRSVVKKGDKVTVKFSPLKDGRMGGALNMLTLPDGTMLRAATPACAAPQNAGAAAPAKPN